MIYFGRACPYVDCGFNIMFVLCEFVRGEQVKSIFVPTEQTTLTNELCAPLVATLPLEVLSLFFYDFIEYCRSRDTSLIAWRRHNFWAPVYLLSEPALIARNKSGQQLGLATVAKNVDP